MKIALNDCYGGFEVSQKAYERLIELGVKISKDRTSSSELCIHEYTGEDIEFYGRYSSYLGDMRTNPLLIQVIEELGNDANGECADIRIVEIPDSIEYYIDDYGGIETVHECHESW